MASELVHPEESVCLEKMMEEPSRKGNSISRAWRPENMGEREFCMIEKVGEGLVWRGEPRQKELLGSPSVGIKETGYKSSNGSPVATADTD